MKRCVYLLVAGVGLAAVPSRADIILSPSSSQGVVQINGPMVTYGANFGSVGQGNGNIAGVVAVELIAFDLSQVKSPIAVATISGNFSGFAARYGGPTIDPTMFLSFLTGGIGESTQTPPQSTLQALFNYIGAMPTVGGFSVNNGFPSFFNPSAGNYSVTLNAAFLEQARLAGSPIYFGYGSSSAGSQTPTGGVASAFAGFSASLDIQIVPEPTAAGLLGAGLAGLGLARLRHGRRGPN
jgi:hypothetical protein